jgi:hypothetical protein
MAATVAFEDQVLKLIFNAVDIPKIATNATLTPLTDLYVSLHTSSPGPTGAQETNEVVYTGYARMPVKRDATGWTVFANNVNPTAMITFPAPTAVPTGIAQIATYFGVGELLPLTPGGKLYYYGVLAPPMQIILAQSPRIDNQPIPSNMSPNWD